jgi:hypothetical protein
MSSFKDMVDEVKSKLTGYTLRQDRISYVANTGGITTSTAAIQIGSSENLGKGIIEIDDELIWVDSFSKSTSTLNVIPGFGRGYQNTTATPHSQYSPVTIAPTFPRVQIKKAINDAINASYPKLWATATKTFSYSSVVNTYAIPDDAQYIIGVSYQEIGPTKEWKPVKGWTLDPMANVSAFNSGNTITIKDTRIPPGRTVQVTYIMKPNTLTGDSEDFTDVSGLPQSSEDVIILGAVARLLTFVDPGRATLTSAEADLADSKIPVGTITNSAKYIYALYQQRLQEESDKLLGKYPVRVHYTR